MLIINHLIHLSEFRKVVKERDENFSMITSLTRENHDLSFDLVEEKEKNLNLRTEIAGFKMEKNGLRNEHEALRSENKQLRTENERLKKENKHLRDENKSVINENEDLKKKNQELELKINLKENMSHKRKLSEKEEQPQLEEHREKSNKTSSPQTSVSSTSHSPDSLALIDLDLETDLDSQVKRLKLYKNRESNEPPKKQKFVLRKHSPKVGSKGETRFETSSPNRLNKNILALIPKKKDDSKNDSRINASSPDMMSTEELMKGHESIDYSQFSFLEHQKSLNDESKDSSDNGMEQYFQLKRKEKSDVDNFEKPVEINYSHELFTDSLIFVEPDSPEPIPIITIESTQEDEESSCRRKKKDSEKFVPFDINQQREMYDKECQDCMRYYNNRMFQVPVKEVDMEIVECETNCEGYRSRVEAIRSKPNYKPKVHYMQANNRARRAVVEKNMDRHTPDDYWNLRLSPVKLPDFPKFNNNY